MFERMFLGGMLAGLSLAAFAGDDLSASEQKTIDRWLGERREVAAPAKPAKAGTAAPVEQLLSGLEQRLEQSPNDQAGWSLLAQTYAYLGRMEDARDAAAHAVELGADADQLQQSLVAAHTDRARTD
jgi:cytochrome c-type biogenesis protein CcmH/NrfG